MPGIRNKSHNEMMNILNQFVAAQLGFAPVGEIRMLTNGTSNAHSYFRDRINEANLHTSIYKAENAMVTQRNDILLVTPDSHAWKGDTDAGGEALTWDKQSTHLVGMAPGDKAAYQRVRFSHAGFTMANFMTVSGASNLFKNLRWMHGTATGGASDTTCITVTGAGNVFDHCNFAGPMDATQGSSNNYIGVALSGTSNYFKGCVFGTANAVDRNGTSCMLSLSGGGQMNIFEDCIFRSHSTANAFFIKWASTETPGFAAAFLNCQFMNQKAAAEADMTYAITDSSHANCMLYFDNRCTFSGVTDIVALASEAKVDFGCAGANADVTAINDRLNLGMAVNPNVS